MSRDVYLEKLKVQLDGLNAELDRLMAESRKEGVTEVGIEYGERIAELRRRRETIEQQAAEIEEAGEGAWEELKEGLEKTWEGLKAVFREAKSEFERGYRAGMEEEEESPSPDRKELKK